MWVHQVEPQEKRRLPDGGEPGAGMVHNHVRRGKPAESVERCGNRRHTLTIVEIKLVIHGAHGPHAGSNRLQCPVYSTCPTSNLSLLVRNRLRFVLQKIAKRIESLCVRKAR